MVNVQERNCAECTSASARPQQLAVYHHHATAAAAATTTTTRGRRRVDSGRAPLLAATVENSHPVSVHVFCAFSFDIAQWE